jgi:hypothetical protein
MPIAATGSFASIRGSAFLQMVERKVDWIWRRSSRIKRLLAGAWMMSRDGKLPVATAEAFEEAVAWRFGPLVKGSARLAHRLSQLARGEGEREPQPGG